MESDSKQQHSLPWDHIIPRYWNRLLVQFLLFIMTLPLIENAIIHTTLPLSTNTLDQQQIRFLQYNPVLGKTFFLIAIIYNNTIIILKLATIVEGDPKAPFSIATTPRCRGGRYSIPRIASLYPWTVPYNAEC